MDDFLLRALAGGLGVALVAGPLGSFVSWRRMAFFGDTLAHSALLGIAVGMTAGLGMQAGVLAMGICIAGLLMVLQREKNMAP